MENLTILPGRNRQGQPEDFISIHLARGRLYTIVGNTGSGKSRLIKDVEQLAQGDSVTGRTILLDGTLVSRSRRQMLSGQMVAHLGQNMRFVLDTTVKEFLQLHARCRSRQTTPEEILELVNDITPEPVSLEQNLNQLSGGQSRALMIGDISLICDSPIVLIDEIENAGIDKQKALNLLCRQDKLVLVVTHDPHTALMSEQRIVLSGGAITAVVRRTPTEEILYRQLETEYQKQRLYQTLLRKGEPLV